MYVQQRLGLAHQFFGALFLCSMNSYLKGNKVLGCVPLAFLLPLPRQPDGIPDDRVSSHGSAGIKPWQLLLDTMQPYRSPQGELLLSARRQEGSGCRGGEGKARARPVVKVCGANSKRFGGETSNLILFSWRRADVQTLS